jgi:iron complex outermembrane receptor protein
MSSFIDRPRRPAGIAPVLLIGALALQVQQAWADSGVVAAPESPEAVQMAMVTVLGGRPSSLPMQIATTIEGVSGAQIEQSINAADAEDALKYLPSLNVRKRFVGDYDHAVLASRASGTSNSARSLVYADGILLSNLLGNGAGYTPRWGMVTPDEIERVDVLYGPFSAAYPGNSAGAVVDYVTRMPTRLELHARLSGFSQGFAQYATNERFRGRQGAASVGNQNGKLAWWLSLSRLDNDGQPIAFANRLVGDGVVGKGGTAVTGALADKNPAGRDWLILGSTNQVHTLQDHAKLKLAYELTPSVRANYTLGWWSNAVERESASYLRDAAGVPVSGGKISVDGRAYTLTPADFASARGTLEHVMHGLSVKSHTKGLFDWELAASLYDYRRDLARTPSVYVDGAPGPKAGNLTDLGGTGWNTLALKGVWRPGAPGEHVVDLGLQRDAFKLRTQVAASPDWEHGGARDLVSRFDGDTRLESAYAQDTWKFAPGWKSTLGGRLEQWRAFDGSLANASAAKRFGTREQSGFSPKLALAHEWDEQWTFKGSLGRALRFPTVAELYQGALVGDTLTNNDPNLKPELSWTGELSAERRLDNGLLRATVFFERTRDALYAQKNVSVTPNVTNIQNVERIGTTGLELAAQTNDFVWNGFDLSGSATFTDSTIDANRAFPASVGKQQPRVPKWRANLLASYHPGAAWSATFGARYSGRQFGTLDNSDRNGATYTGVSDYLVTDLRLRYRFDRQWSAALGVDNLGNKTYWAFHPYTQRTVVAELQFDLR